MLNAIANRVSMIGVHGTACQTCCMLCLLTSVCTVFKQQVTQVTQNLRHASQIGIQNKASAFDIIKGVTCARLR